MTAPRVPFVDLERQHAPLRNELRDAFERVVGASGFVLGREVEEFERAFAAYCGTRHCIGVASGTAALTLALQSLGIGDGDEVIVPGHTFVASALGVVHAGATPVFCDVEEGTGLLDTASAEDVVTQRTAAVIAVHLYGQVCDMDAVAALAQRHGLKVVEDAAQAHGATWRGRRAGGLGDVAAFSFYPSKNLGALGDGGAICTDDDEVAEAARALRHIGQRSKGLHEMLGWNERLDGLQAALLRVKLPHLDSWNADRRRHAAVLRDALPASLGRLEVRAEAECVYHLFPVRSAARHELRAALDAAGIDTGIHYTPAVHEQPIFQSDDTSVLPNSEAWAAQELSLPMFNGMTDDELSRIASAVPA